MGPSPVPDHPPFALVVFDLDGTLIDSRGDIADALNAALGDVRLPRLSDEEIESLIGSGARTLASRAIDVGLRNDGQAPRHGGESDALVDEVLGSFLLHYAERPTARTTVYPGVLDGLARLSSVKRVIATNKRGDLARSIARDLGLLGLVDRVLGQGDVPHHKPDPAMLDEAIRGAGALRAGTLYVGDGPIDVLTARAASVPLCLVGWGYRRDEALASEPEFRVDRFEQIVDLVRRGARG